MPYSCRATRSHEALIEGSLCLSFSSPLPPPHLYTWNQRDTCLSRCVRGPKGPQISAPGSLPALGPNPRGSETGLSRERGGGPDWPAPDLQTGAVRCIVAAYHGLGASLPFSGWGCPRGWWSRCLRALLSPPPLPARARHCSGLALLSDSSPEPGKRSRPCTGRYWEASLLPHHVRKAPWGPREQEILGDLLLTRALKNVLGTVEFLADGQPWGGEGALGAGVGPSELAGAVGGEVRVAEGRPRPGEPRGSKCQAGQGWAASPRAKGGP